MRQGKWRLFESLLKNSEALMCPIDVVIVKVRVRVRVRETVRPRVRERVRVSVRIGVGVRVRLRMRVRVRVNRTSNSNRNSNNNSSRKSKNSIRNSTTTGIVKLYPTFQSPRQREKLLLQSLSCISVSSSPVTFCHLLPL